MISHSKLIQESTCASEATISRYTKVRQPVNLRISSLSSHLMEATDFQTYPIPSTISQKVLQHTTPKSETRPSKRISESFQEFAFLPAWYLQKLKAHCFARINAAAETEPSQRTVHRTEPRSELSNCMESCSVTSPTNR
jgi:hypothetical protein